ncbi:hypothetical protein GEMRC1_010483 [Eukaryota sp. GEM-RC1]
MKQFFVFAFLFIALVAAVSSASTGYEQEFVSHETSSSNSVPCQICTWIIGNLHDRLEDHTTRDEIIHFVEGVCTYVPESLRAVCVSMIDQYGNLIIDMLVERYPADVVCQAVGACPVANNFNSVACPLCQWLIGSIEAKISDETTKHEIIHFVEQVCNFVPESMETLCVAMVEQYGTMIIDMLIERFPADTVCKAIKMCPDEIELVDDNTVGCQICTWIIGTIEAKISDETTKHEIIHFVEQVCNFVPESMRVLCISMVEQYGTMIIDMLVERLSADTVCKAIKLCPEDVELVDDNNVGCQICTWIIGTIEAKISDESTEQEIIHFVQQVCNFVPESMKTLCAAMIDQYGHMIIDMLVERYPADTVCKAIKLCPKEVELVEDNTIGCQICTWIIGTIEAKISDESTEQEIIHFVQQVCNFVPESMKTLCAAMIDQYGHMIIDMLVERYPADTVCKAIKLCPKEVELVEDNTIGCQICTWIIGTIEAKISDESTEQEIIHFVQQVCNFVPESMKTLCAAMIDQYGHMIIDMLVERYPADTVCKAIKLCPKEVELVEDNTIGCQICTWIIGTIEAKISDESTEQEIIHFVQQVCNFVPESMKTLCAAMIDQYGHMIIDMLVERYPADTVCKAIKLCPKEVELVEDNTIGCQICTWIIGTIEAKISDESTEQEIIHFVQQVCNFVPESMKTLCAAMIDQYGHMIIDMLVERYPADTVCKAIKLCPKEVELVEDNTIGCQICTWIIGTIEAKISDESTEQEIIHFVQQVCNFVPESMKTLCAAMIDQYGHMIIDMLVERYPADTVCKAIKLCPKEVELVEDNTIGCQICTWIIGTIEAKISDESTEQEIIHFVQQVCNFVPESMKTLCAAMIDQYGHMIIDMLVERYPADTVCKAIKLCPKEVELVEDNNVGCQICTWVIGTIEAKISEETTRQEIITYVEQVCNIIPESMRLFCVGMIEQYGNMIIDMLVERFTADIVCKALKLCPEVVYLDSENGWTGCKICTYLIGKIEQFLHEESTVQEIIEFVENACNYVPAGARSYCHDFISEFGGKMINWLVNKIDAEKMCEFIRVCEAEPALMFNEVDTETNGWTKCHICTYIIGKVELLLNDESTIQEIVHFVEHVCEYVPSGVQGLCHDFINEFGGKLVHWLVDRIDARQFCEAIRICEKEVLMTQEENNFFCPLCKSFVKDGVNYLEEIKQHPEVVEQLCDYIEDPTQKFFCKTLVKGALPTIIDEIVENIDHLEVCEKLKLC